MLNDQGASRAHGTDGVNQKDYSKCAFASAYILSRHMSKLVNRKVFSDVHFFVGPEREKIFGHRCILIARNEVFRLLLSNEPKKSSYELPVCRPVTFLLLVYFLYTNSISFDRLNIYEVYELLQIAKYYKCPELEKLAQVQIGHMLDAKTSFEFLTKACELDQNYLRDAAREYIEEFSMALLNPTNKDILTLSPVAMETVLESNLLDLDEMQVIEVACFWAEHYLYQMREKSADTMRNQKRISIVRVDLSRVESEIDSSLDITPPADRAADECSNPASVTMRQALEDVARVMKHIRLAALTPNELAKLEETNLTKRLIPQEYFVDAWRQLALKSSTAKFDVDALDFDKRPRRGTHGRPKSRSNTETVKRSRSVVRALGE